jgi:small subunit ribosomal protein S8
VIQHLQRVSTPGRRVYHGVRNARNVLQGLGVCILSTNQGVVSNREAKAKNVGGEVLCEVW